MNPKPLHILLFLFVLTGLWALVVLPLALRPLERLGDEQVTTTGRVSRVDVMRAPTFGNWSFTVRRSDSEEVTFVYEGLRSAPPWAESLRVGDSLVVVYHPIATSEAQVGPRIAQVRRGEQTLLDGEQAYAFRAGNHHRRLALVIAAICVGIASAARLVADALRARRAAPRDVR